MSIRLLDEIYAALHDGESAPYTSINNPYKYDVIKGYDAQFIIMDDIEWATEILAKWWYKKLKEFDLNFPKE